MADFKSKPRAVAAALPAALLALAPTTPGPQAAEAWPAAVHARYKLKFNGIDVGHIDFNSKAGAQSYTLASTGEVSVLFGAIKWTGASNVTGAIQSGKLQPKTYAFDWKKKSKGGVIHMGYAGGKATEVSVEPAPSPHPDTVPIKPEHKVGTLDPMSAIMQLTRADTAAPCDRRVAVFDGKQRYDIVFSYKRQAHIPALKSDGKSSIGVVCRAMYEPIAGHRANPDSKAYAANKDAEVTLRKIPGSELMIPYSVTVPTAWGTGTMVTERVDVTSVTAGQLALTE